MFGYTNPSSSLKTSQILSASLSFYSCMLRKASAHLNSHTFYIYKPHKTPLTIYAWCLEGFKHCPFPTTSDCNKANLF
jgi:hypothetical protein